MTNQNWKLRKMFFISNFNKQRTTTTIEIFVLNFHCFLFSRWKNLILGKWLKDNERRAKKGKKKSSPMLCLHVFCVMYEWERKFAICIILTENFVIMHYTWGIPYTQFNSWMIGKIKKSVKLPFFGLNFTWQTTETIEK